MTRVVLDVSVARSSGDETATHPNAVACRETLKAVNNNPSILLVMTNEILDEWLKIDLESKKSYASAWSIKWLLSMRSKKRVTTIKAIKINEFDQCAKVNLIPEHLKELRKDAHLFYAALASDKKVISCDKKCWQYAIAIADCYPRIQGLYWVNPNDSYCLEWISEGANDNPYWTPSNW
jgi:hypothetical protein